MASSSLKSLPSSSRRSLSTSLARHSYYDTIPNLAAGPHSNIIVQGFTGKASTVHTQISLDMGTNVVAGVSPGKGGSKHLGGRPVFDSVQEVLDAGIRVDATSVFVPPALAANAIIEAIKAEIPLIVSVAEGVPVKDQFRVMEVLHSQSKSRLVGANSPGYCNPRGCRMGIAPMITCAPGPVGIASRSGTLSYEAAYATKPLGQSYILGLGGDFYPGTRTVEALEFLFNDKDTDAIVLAGEIGGTMEEEVYELLNDPNCKYRVKRERGRFVKPIVGFIAGLNTPPGQMFGHAGAIWRDGMSGAVEKKKMWESVGIRMADAIADVGKLVEGEMREYGLQIQNTS
ncbi:related to succinyl-coa ligase [gdp-forming] alpha-chain, mitochondrial precursor [Melanopsichium pennsylvanicum]|uniref:Related to succinyl-coa ligase [gdp-forming] alpha-chain, mitochondrial n=2 Tax=Melanopsichium pennsylvanicum TaxID=63383 RepID=A0AAJ4XJM5_9BASI|nr:related to succinyl-coa ligase [gdp-forming] alpha-chain, mitochondrial precursor [Melanopsichium pennsylvanicum 4]SNX82946.1 related to succinyl-coa ligase [gdp-forming] alpha-chain, mitochondrial precursor [Melanopsichium pennsylvanicum]